MARLKKALLSENDKAAISKAIENRKNKKLLQAAPQLLEALQDMLNQGCGYYDKKSCGHNFYCVCPSDKARLAIKAATE